MEYFVDFGCVGLFFASFLAATILPLSSEVVLGGLLLGGLNPVLLVSVATVGNVLGSVVNYVIGFRGSDFLVTKVLRISDDESLKSHKIFKKYGVLSLFFAWIPVVGDPLTFVAGVIKTDLLLFFTLVTSGKLIRYTVIAYVLLP